MEKSYLYGKVIFQWYLSYRPAGIIMEKFTFLIPAKMACMRVYSHTGGRYESFIMAGMIYGNMIYDKKRLAKSTLDKN